MLRGLRRGGARWVGRGGGARWVGRWGGTRWVGRGGRVRRAGVSDPLPRTHGFQRLKHRLWGHVHLQEVHYDPRTNE